MYRVLFLLPLMAVMLALAAVLVLGIMLTSNGTAHGQVPNVVASVGGVPSSVEQFLDTSKIQPKAL